MYFIIINQIKTRRLSISLMYHLHYYYGIETQVHSGGNLLMIPYFRWANYLNKLCYLFSTPTYIAIFLLKNRSLFK